MNLTKLFKRNKPNGFNKAALADYKLIEVFTHNGHTYYRYPRETNMPLERFQEVMTLLERLSSGLSGSEMELILDKMDAAIAAGLSQPKNAATMAALVHIIRERQTSVIHRDLLLNLAAVWLIRDDEKPSIVNPEIHKQKLEVFEALAEEGARDFFTKISIEPLMPLLGMSADEFQMLWNYNRTQMAKLKEAVTLVGSHLTTERAKPKSA